MKKFLLNEVGIGDIIIFLSYLSEYHKNEIVGYDFNIDTIKTYKTEDYVEYYEFIKDFSKFILDNTDHDNFSFDNTSSNGHTLITINDIRNKFQNIEGFKYIKSNQPNEISKDSVVLLTKVRGCDYMNYNQIKDNFYKIINEGNKNIILLGEKEVETNPEYLILTNQVVYSIYGDILNNINKDKIIDLTIDKLGITSPNIEKLTYDVDIIKKHNVISFGSSGIVSLCSIFTNVLSYVNSEPFNKFLDSNEIELKSNSEDFINNLKSILK